jgi:hypothetical protein
MGFMNQILIKNNFTLNPHKTAVTQLLPWWGIIVKVSSGWRIYTQGHMVLGNNSLIFQMLLNPSLPYFSLISDP